MDPDKTYDELKELIEINSLFERKELDMEGIQDCLDETLRILDSGETLSGYDSRVMDAIKQKCLNQNWTLAEEDDVLALITKIENLLQKHRDDISAFYFYDFCNLLCSISRMGTSSEKRKITTFFIEQFFVLCGSYAILLYLFYGRNRKKDACIGKSYVRSRTVGGGGELFRYQARICIECDRKSEGSDRMVWKYGI